MSAQTRARLLGLCCLSLALLAGSFCGCFPAEQAQPAASMVSTTRPTASPTALQEETPYPTSTLEAAPSTGQQPTLTSPPDAPATVELPEVPLPESLPTRRSESVHFTVVYDNNDFDPTLRTAWGFGCLIEMDRHTVLFDTGGDGDILLGNMRNLGLEPEQVEIVVLSHIHADHTGGLNALLSLPIQPTVYIPQPFPQAFKDQVTSRTEACEVTGPAEILPGLWTTGVMGKGIQEQALAVDTAEGLVVVTGCAHPGVARLVHRAVEYTGRQPYLVMGGFHLGGASRRPVEGIIAEFRQIGVQKVAPCHCTGEEATQMFAEAFGEDFVPCGAGLRIAVGE